MKSYVSVWNWIQIFCSYKFYRRKRISASNVYETMVQVDCKHVWIRIAIEHVHKLLLGNHISKARNNFVAENFSFLFSKYEKHTLYTVGGT